MGLKLGGYIEFGGKYAVKFADVDPTNWNRAAIEIYENGNRVARKILEEGQTMYYPDENNPLFGVEVTGIWESQKTAYIEIKTPVKLFKENITLKEGESYTMPSGFPQYKITVRDVPSDTKAELTIRYPDGTTVTRTLEKDYPVGVPYKISSELTQSSVLVIEYVKASKDKSVTFNLYIAKMIFAPAKVVQPEEQKEEKTTTEEPIQVVYDDVIYAGEKVTITYNKTTYQIQLVSVGYYSKFDLIIDDKSVETATVKEGGSYIFTKAPLRVEVIPNTVDLKYNRLQAKIYAPIGASGSVILREANITVRLDISQNRVLLGEEIIVFIKVKNEGKGNAFNVKVLAPIPNNFELISGIGTWELSRLEPFSEMPVLIYTLKPNAVGNYSLGPVIVEYYNELGKKITVKSNIIEDISVYGVPQLELTGGAIKDGETKNYAEKETNSTIRLRFTISAQGEDSRFEFIKNATLYLELGDFLDGKDSIVLGTIKAGEEKVVEEEYKILKEGVYPLKVILKYQDPLGNWHEEIYPNVILINSVPPKIIVKTQTIEKWPEPEELPEYIDKVLATLENATPLAQKISNITEKYIPKQQEKETNIVPYLLGVLILALGIGLVYTAYELNLYKTKLKALEAKKRKPRPGGLPKKEDKTDIRVLEQISQQETTKEKTQ